MAAPLQVVCRPSGRGQGADCQLLRRPCRHSRRCCGVDPWLVQRHTRCSHDLHPVGGVARAAPAFRVHVPAAAVRCRPLARLGAEPSACPCCLPPAWQVRRRRLRRRVEWRLRLQSHADHQRLTILLAHRDASRPRGGLAHSAADHQTGSGCCAAAAAGPAQPAAAGSQLCAAAAPAQPAAACHNLCAAAAGASPRLLAVSMGAGLLSTGRGWLLAAVLC